jgi:transposase-like protein
VALDQEALLEVLDALKAAEVDDRIRQAAQTIYQALIQAELTAVIGAAPHERTPERLTQRNGHRPRLLTTSAGDLELAIPKLAMRGVKRRLGPVSGHRGVAAQQVRAEPTTGRARTA